ncbi:CoA transferase [Bacillus badius]|uniref:CaiB/BaiF CoA transferase family protein n=1 Tax=Bacillus badius TaxID=1455 RepID=UPI001CBF8C75|nr:CaiB/BaiF CoA-transferase family protein [Bacillus badius]UAT32105.1 CoA transferase [Bacillus badius]
MTLLKGLKVLDFSTLLPGPFATLLLSDLGAEVLRIERPSNQKSWIVDQYLNRSKSSVELDLKKPESVDQVKQLAEEYDIVIEQFRPGVMERLGLGYKDLKKVNPRIIYCSLTGFGQTGPLKDRPGHDINYLALSGVSGYSGKKAEGPAQNGTQIADLNGSLYTALAILAAVIYRTQTGEGQSIDMSMTDCSFSLNALFAPLSLNHGMKLEPEKLMLNGGTFYGYYQTKDGRFFSVGSLEPAFRKELCEAIGRPDLFDMSMSEHPVDVRLFKEILTATFLEKTFTEWLAIFEKAEACVEPVLTFEEACEHPHLKERGLIVQVPDGQGGFQRQIACPIKTSAFHPQYKQVDRSLRESSGASLNNIHP